MQILDGEKYYNLILKEIQKEVESLKKKPTLAIILLGDNNASLSYIKAKEKAFCRVGMKIKKFFLNLDTSYVKLSNLIQRLNADKNINGIIIQLPLPQHIDTQKIIFHISPVKDVDGFHPINLGKLFVGLDGLYPCTPLGILDLLSRYKINLKGKIITVIGKSNIVGKPTAMMLLNQKATVIICDEYTKDLKKHTKISNIIISATGKPHLINSSFIKKDAILIDVGFSYKQGKLYGDIDFESVKNKAKYISPVPGGIGKMTVAYLVKNTLKAYKIQNNIL